MITDGHCTSVVGNRIVKPVKKGQDLVICAKVQGKKGKRVWTNFEFEANWARKEGLVADRVVLLTSSILCQDSFVQAYFGDLSPETLQTSNRTLPGRHPRFHLISNSHEKRMVVHGLPRPIVDGNWVVRFELPVEAEVGRG